jgi:hypothetical protein
MITAVELAVLVAAVPVVVAEVWAVGGWEVVVEWIGERKLCALGDSWLMVDDRILPVLLNLVVLGSRSYYDCSAENARCVVMRQRMKLLRAHRYPELATARQSRCVHAEHFL